MSSMDNQDDDAEKTKAAVDHLRSKNWQLLPPPPPGKARTIWVADSIWAQLNAVRKGTIEEAVEEALQLWAAHKTKLRDGGGDNST